MKSQKGFTLVEVVIALLLLGVISTAVFGALSTSSKSAALVDTRETARNYAQYQIEYIKTLTYASSYALAPQPAIYNRYTATLAVQNPQNDEQILTVTVTGNGSTINLTAYRMKP
jgi:prepilin-type N-terminal cleavage/methylation domain-containing protein